MSDLKSLQNHLTYEMRRNERIVSPELRNQVRNAVLQADPEAYARTCEAVVDEEHRDSSYDSITALAVLIAGDKDAISPIERSTGLSVLMGGKSWVEVVKSGHQPILEDLSGVRQAIRRLLQCVSGHINPFNGSRWQKKSTIKSNAPSASAIGSNS